MIFKNLIRKIDYKRISLHIGFWLVAFAYATYLYGYPDQLREVAKLLAMTWPIDMIHVYLVLYFLIPRFLLRQKYILFGALFLLFGVLEEILAQFAFYYIYFPELYKGQPFLSWELVSHYFGYLWIAFSATVIKLIKIWLKKNKEAQQANEEKYQAELKLKEAELKLLKAQVHPHFLFNTLNNLYGLTLEASKKAPEVVLKLSALLDYMLYKCNTKTVLLNNEIEHLKNYIDLEKLRYDDELEIIFNHHGNIGNIQIAPLLLIPFVENSFKHGVNNSQEKPWIKIDLKTENEELIFKIENSKNREKIIDSIGYTDGIGLKNVKQRLDLSYKDHYLLDINEDENIFSVKLVINLQKEPIEDKMHYS
jgi:two-component system, LytTR family, sensor kinase